jgi:hypothetical protein
VTLKLVGAGAPVIWALDDTSTARITSQPDGSGVLIGTQPGFLGAVVANNAVKRLYACSPSGCVYLKNVTVIR